MNLCVRPGSLVEQGPGGSQATCTGGLNIANYGWMLHLYNFVPNVHEASKQAGGEDARFSRWNRNLAFPVCGYSTSGACTSGGAGIAGVASDIEFGEGAFVCPILSSAALEKLTQ